MFRNVFNIIKTNIYTIFIVILAFTLMRTYGSINSEYIKDNGVITLFSFYKVVFNTHFVLLFILPSYIVINYQLTNFYIEYKVLLRYQGSKFLWWKELILSQLKLSLLFAVAINLIFVVSVLINGVTQVLNPFFIFVLIIIFSIETLGFLIISVSSLLVLFIISNKFFTNIIIYTFIVVPVLVKGFIYKEIYSFSDYMFLVNIVELEMFFIKGCSVFFWFLLILVLLLMINLKQIKRKDILWRS
ncbi:hypothetical protein QFZ73_005859 [Peribacillus sp. V2I11]|nr:hypothetical protein [Peribacillus sp. V2I11]